MQIVIKISKSLYDRVIGMDIDRDTCSFNESALVESIQNGTPLPKHGDLKDADKLKHAFISWSMAVQGYFTDADIASIICNSQTIIEADKEERVRSDKEVV